jgi:hypothetical protein
MRGSVSADAARILARGTRGAPRRATPPSGCVTVFPLAPMSERKTHFGRAGEYFAMSELLLRGWNVAVPVVDVGDDVFVIDDNDKTTWRLQVKASERIVKEGRQFLALRIRSSSAFRASSSVRCSPSSCSTC